MFKQNFGLQGAAAVLLFSAEFMPTRRILIKDQISKHHTFNKEPTDV